MAPSRGKLTTEERTDRENAWGRVHRITRGPYEGLIKCRVCRCTEYEACNPPCHWVRNDWRGDICSTCDFAARQMQEFIRAIPEEPVPSNRIHARSAIGRLMKEVRLRECFRIEPRG